MPEEKTITACNSAGETWRLSVTGVVTSGRQNQRLDGRQGVGRGGVLGYWSAAVDGRGGMGVDFKQSGEVSGNDPTADLALQWMWNEQAARFTGRSSPEAS